MAENPHAVLSPSSSSRWMACAGSVILEAGEPNDDNEYSKEGSLAHAVAAHCLEKGINATDILSLTFRGKREVVPDDMRDYVQEYVDYVREKAEGAELMVEQGLDLSSLTGEKEAYGTADAIILKDKRLHLIDFKYGYRSVSAQENSQLRMYGLAASDVFSLLADIEEFELCIYQPRIGNIDSEVVSIEEMKKFEQKVREAAERVAQARKSNSLDGFLHTGSQCKNCRARHKCSKLISEVQEETLVDFSDETQTALPEPVDLAKAGAKLELIEAWMKGVRTKIEAELFSGRPVKGWKLVEGKKGNREFIDEEEVVESLGRCGIAKGKLYASKLLTPAKVEKLLKGNAKALEVFPGLYSQKAGKPGVAPRSDKRPEYRLKPEDDFSEEP